MVYIWLEFWGTARRLQKAWLGAMGEVWGGVTPPTGEGKEARLCHQKKINFYLVMACSGVFSVCAVASHCNASNPVLESLKHEKIGGQFTLASPTPNYGGLVPRPHVPHDLRPCHETYHLELQKLRIFAGGRGSDPIRTLHWGS